MDKNIEPSDFTLTVLEIRTLVTILKTLLDRQLLPPKQAWIVKGVVTNMEKVHLGEYN